MKTYRGKEILSFNKLKNIPTYCCLLDKAFLDVWIHYVVDLLPYLYIIQQRVILLLLPSSFSVTKTTKKNLE